MFSDKLMRETEKREDSSKKRCTRREQLNWLRSNMSRRLKLQRNKILKSFRTGDNNFSNDLMI